MSAPLYAYRYPCVVQDPQNPTNVIVVGINETTDSHIEVTRVDLTNIASPKATRLQSIQDAARWSSKAERVCVLYPVEAWRSDVPEFYMTQFGARSFTADLMVNGTVYEPDKRLSLRSPKLYSFVGAFQDRQFVTAVASSASEETDNPWVALDVTRKHDNISGVYNFELQQKPPPDALLSVGTYPVASRMPVLGYLTVFDATGSKGLTYSTSSSHQPTESVTDTQALRAPIEVEMSGITLTKDAMSITMGTTGYIIDAAPDGSGSTVLYAITPRSKATPTLILVKVNGNVPRFIPGRVSTAMDSSKLLLFGGIQNGTTIVSLFHQFDTSNDTWSGPDLVAPYISQKSTSKSPRLEIVIGVAVTGVVVLVLAILVIRRRFRHRNVHVVLPDSEMQEGSRHVFKDEQRSSSAEFMTDIIYPQPQPQPQPLLLLLPQPHDQQLQQIDNNINSNIYSVYETPQPTVYQPPLSNASLYHIPPTTLSNQDYMSPAATVTCADRGSVISPISAYSTASASAAQPPPNGPQSLPHEGSSKDVV